MSDENAHLSGNGSIDLTALAKAISEALLLAELVDEKLIAAHLDEAYNLCQKRSAAVNEVRKAEGLP